MLLSGPRLLDKVAERVIGRWLVKQGHADARPTGGLQSFGGPSVDMTYTAQGVQRKVKIKADPYFGLDARRVSDRSLTYYRGDASAFAFEAVANASTREPGWMFATAADEIFYYYLAITQTEDEVAALVSESDDVLFTELAVERDELVTLPVSETRAWFEAHYEQYTPRPVMSGGASAWYRLVPRADIEYVVPGIRSVGSIFKSLGR